MHADDDDDRPAALFERQRVAAPALDGDCSGRRRDGAFTVLSRSLQALVGGNRLFSTCCANLPMTLADPSLL